MRAIEFPAKMSPEKTIVLPEEIAKEVPVDTELRVMILMKDHDDDRAEEEAWNRLGIEQFFAGYAPEDSMYDNYKKP
ncbi:MAG: hypothetical protein HY961_13365 [Ignavibacteriae bacterium]|nr:hypothetical protein [Ignavibacteriota bacterium]